MTASAKIEISLSFSLTLSECLFFSLFISPLYVNLYYSIFLVATYVYLYHSIVLSSFCIITFSLYHHMPKAFYPSNMFRNSIRLALSFYHLSAFYLSAFYPSHSIFLSSFCILCFSLYRSIIFLHSILPTLSFYHLSAFYPSHSIVLSSFWILSFSLYRSIIFLHSFFLYYNLSYYLFPSAPLRPSFSRYSRIKWANNWLTVSEKKMKQKHHHPSWTICRHIYLHSSNPKNNTTRL